MIWTHIYDLILKLFCLLAPIALLAQIPFLEQHNALLFVFSFILSGLSYYAFFRTLGSQLYSQLVLKMPLSFSEAKKLNAAFAPLIPFPFEWLPMKEIAQVEAHLKYEMALQILHEWQTENKLKRAQYLSHFSNSSLKTKIMTGLAYLTIAYLIVASFINIPPVSYLSAAYMGLFNTNEYYPILNMLVSCLLALVFFKSIDKNIRL